MSDSKTKPLRAILVQHAPERITPNEDERVQFAGVRWYGEGLFVREERLGSEVIGKCYALKPGTLVYNRLFAWKQSFAVVEEEHRGLVVSNEFPQFDVDPAQARADFVALFCSSPRFAELAKNLSTGASAISRNRLKEHDFLTLPIELPSLDVQSKIIKIMQAVDETALTVRGELEAARTARAALLHHLLDSKIGDVPLRQLGSVASWSSGSTPKADNPAYYGGDIPWAVIGDVKGRSVATTSRTINEQGLEAIGGRRKLVPPGAVLVTMYGTIGNSAIAEVPMATNQAICRAVPNELVTSDYLRLWISASQTSLIELGEGKTQMNINKKKIEQFPIKVPEPTVQGEIVAVMASVDDHIEALEREAKRASTMRHALLDYLLLGEIDLITSTNDGSSEIDDLMESSSSPPH